MLKFDRKDPEFYPRMREILLRDNYWQGELWNHRKNGEFYPEWMTITAVVGKDGRITNYICAFFDITERKQAEDKIHNLAFYDPLTQLPTAVCCLIVCTRRLPAVRVTTTVPRCCSSIWIISRY